MGRIGHAKVGVSLLKRYYHDGTMVAMMAAAGKSLSSHLLTPF
jgi:hypothetical protein